MSAKTHAEPLELHLEEAGTQVLEYDGWRSFKMEQNFSEKKQKRTGEAGMPDRLYIRYLAISGATKDWSEFAEVLWIEWKRLKGKKATETSQSQKDWQLLERKRGALIWVPGEDFPATIEGFREHYKTSGLMRRPIIS